jgi:adenine/guanine phosphoribosyltransferase-like PRPP-binding protein
MAEAYVEPTTGYWQELVPASAAPLGPAARAYRFGYPARLPDGRVLMLPIRRRVEPADRAVASFIPNHASFEVVDAIAGFVADLARPLRPEVVVGMPTLGLALAPAVARLLGHRNFVPLGYSRKFWYEDRLSEPVASITSPQAGKTVYLDPNLVPRLKGRRAVLVDDTISSGSTAAAVVRLLTRASGDPVGLLFAMCQGSAWARRLEGRWRKRVRWVFRSPLLRLAEEGWVPEDTPFGPDGP